MKIDAYGHEYEPGVTICLLSETEVERALLRSLWKHGRMEMVHNSKDSQSQGFAITATSERRAEA